LPFLLPSQRIVFSSSDGEEEESLKKPSLTRDQAQKKKKGKNWEKERK
jgi:hypothetical protein